jgi:hypothetical protein
MSFSVSGLLFSLLGSWIAAAPPYPIYAAMASFVVVFVFSLIKPRGRVRIDARYCRGRFLSENEKDFLNALEAALGGHYRVFTQVRLAELVDVEESDGARRREALNRVFVKSIDFVLCDRATLDPIAAIEVDDKTHARLDRRERDAFVNTVFQQAGLPLVRVSARRSYSAPKIKALLIGAGID